MSGEIVVLITAGGPDEAGLIARTLVDEHLAACVNILPGVRSVFSWQGKTQEAEEVLLVCKSRMDLFSALSDRVRSLHSYDLPEIIALPVTAGLPAYLEWVQETTKRE